MTLCAQPSIPIDRVWPVGALEIISRSAMPTVKITKITPNIFLYVCT